jgi:hypothetical protein
MDLSRARAGWQTGENLMLSPTYQFACDFAAPQGSLLAEQGTHGGSMRYLQYSLAIFAIWVIPSLAACELGADDSQSSDELVLQSAAEALSATESGSAKLDPDLSGPAADFLTGGQREDVGVLASCPPPGSWSSSCRNATCLSGSVFCAQCRKPNGQWSEGITCIDVSSCGAVNNCRGHIQCSGQC